MPIEAPAASLRERTSAPSTSREPAPWLPSGIRFVGEDARASLIHEASRCRFVVVEVEACSRGSLRDAIEEGVELVLARRGALPPGTEMGASATRVVRDQHTRLRASVARGILIALPSLAPYVADGSLPVDDGAAVLGWLKLAQDDATPTVVVALSESDRAVPILVPRSIGTVVDEGDEDEVARSSEVALRPASRVRVVPALAPTALPPPVASDAAFTLSALPSCVALLATTGAPAPVSTDAAFDSIVAARDIERVNASAAPVHDVLEVVDGASIEIAVAVTVSLAASAAEVVDAASATQDDTGAEPAPALVTDGTLAFQAPSGPLDERADAGDDAWAHAGDVIAERATPAPPIDLGVLEPPADEDIAPLAPTVFATSPVSAAPTPRAGRIATSVLHADAPIDDDEDDALGVALAAAVRPPVKPLRELRDVFAEALRIDTPTARVEIPAALDPFETADRAKRGEHTARRVANAAVHRNHAMELEAAKGPKPLAVVHDLFVKHYLPLQAAMAKGELDGAIRAVVEEWRNSFAQSYLGAFASMRMTGKRPTMVLDVPEIATKLGRASNAKNVRLLLVDAMGYDLGKRVSTRMQKTLGSRAALVEEQVLWSALPTTTPTQTFYLARGSNGLRDQEPPPSEPDVSRGRNVSSIRRERIGSREIHKLDLVEARLRSGGDGYEERLEAIAEETAQVVSRFAETLPTRTLLYVFGDHGFTMGPGSSGFLTGAAGQGGASPEEVLVGGFAWLVDTVH